MMSWNEMIDGGRDRHTQYLAEADASRLVRRLPYPAVSALRAGLAQALHTIAYWLDQRGAPETYQRVLGRTRS